MPHLKQRGGALINLGSVASDIALPLQGMYAASKHAVKGFTDALRMELEEERAPVSVTLIKPTSIDTPFPQHAKNYIGPGAQAAAAGVPAGGGGQGDPARGHAPGARPVRRRPAGG